MTTATWTTQKGSRIELTAEYSNGILVNSKLAINGDTKSGTLRKHNGMMVFDFGALIVIPADVVNQINAAKQASIPAAPKVCNLTQDEKDWMFEKFMANDETWPK